MLTSTEAQSPLVETFERYFDVSFCDTEALLLETQRLRYEVYCREFGFEREEDCPGGLETDVFDSQALHCLIRHRATAEIAGCVRLVHLAGGSRQTRLPVATYCAAALEGADLHPDNLPADEVCEISRLAVSAGFRRRFSEQETQLGNLDAAELDSASARSFPLLAVALFMAARFMMLHCGKPHVFTTMEPRLARMLERTGLRFRRLGPVVDYHGRRAAYYLHYTPSEHETSLASIRGDLHGLFRVIDSQLQSQRHVLKPIR
jgi:N-acyl amino acid synthase of PEP-CTERM/exosortase system